MTASVIGGAPYDWDLQIDEEGHRDYTLSWRVETDDPADGPDYALTASGLPTPGAYLNVGNTTDQWAFYQRKGSARLQKREDRRTTWNVQTVFSTRPNRRCQTSAIEDPLLEPHRVRGGFVKTTREATQDKDGDPLTNSAGERFRGPVVQVVDSRPTVELEMNVSWIDVPFLSEYVESVNDAAWWGMASRTIKCTDFTWEQVLYGACYKYFQVAFSFELKVDKWDLHLLDEGDMVAIGGTSPVRYKRAKDEYEELVHVLLDGSGNALASGASSVYLTKRVLREKDFSAVGWPSTLL